MIRAAVVLAALLLLSAAQAGEAIIDARTGALVAGKEADRPRFPASTTKLMTIYVALDAVKAGELSLDDLIRVSASVAAAPPVKLGLKKGRSMRLGDAIHAALILSSNDAARLIAEAVSGSEAAFARRMTKTAAGLGMANTAFYNATGLPDARHISTAADIARLILRLDQDHGEVVRPLFRAPLKWRGGAHAPRNGSVAAVKGARLGKTGFTCAAGYTAAVLIQTKDGPRAIATMANSGRNLRATSLRRLARGEIAAHRFTPPCTGAKPEPRPAPIAIGDWSLTLGVFADQAAALKTLQGSASVVEGPKVVAVRTNKEGYYAVVLAKSLDQAKTFQERLGRAGLRAQLIDQAGRDALRLRAFSGL